VIRAALMPVIVLQPASGLLDLPDEILNLIVGYLRALERRRFMAACRRTAWVTLRAAEFKLRITESTRFAGIMKVNKGSLCGACRH
jgi:hypothetical protein